MFRLDMSHLQAKFLILDTCHPESVYLLSKVVRILGYILEAKKGQQTEKFGKHCPIEIVDMFHVH